MKPGVFVYLSGPITPRNGYTLEDNRAVAEQMLYKCLNIGVACFMPPIIPHSEVDYETCMEYDFAVIEYCTAILMLPRWEDSPGALRERSVAIQLGKEIFNSFEELQEKYGKTNRTDSKRDGKRTRKENRVGQSGSDERPQQSDSEGAHQTEV